MPTQDQLEIIRVSGEIEFYDLDPARGITNIGRHPENDVVIDSPGVAPFHAVLDHRQKPYRLMVLSQVGETTLDGQPLPPHVSTEIHRWGAIGLDGYSIILLEGEVVAARPAPAPAPVPVPQPVPGRPSPPAAAPPALPAVAPAPVPPSEAMVPVPAPAAPAAPPAPRRPVGLPARPLDQPDETIVVELSEREWTIDVDQTAPLEVTIANGGPIVAMFEVRVEGLYEEWLMISSPQVNLNEGERTTVTLAITPPRLPSSRAGAHHFAVIVTSPNYPGRRSQRGATLFINPYYEFAVGELSPRQQTVSWFKRAGQTTVPVTNKGNSNTLFRLDGADDERACSFEFQVPGETVSLATQAETRLPPEETTNVPVRITPHTRRLLGLRKRIYSFTITTTMLEGMQTPRAVLGQLKSAPLIGFWQILLMLFLLTAAIVYLFIPGPNPRLYSEDGQRLAANDNLLTLRYNVSRFKNSSPDNLLNRINGVFLDVTIERKLTGAPDTTYEVVEAALDGPTGITDDTPTRDAVYRLTVKNWLSLLFSRLERTAFWDVTVVPVLPIVEVSPEQKEVELGQPATLSWNVQYADRLVLKTKDGLVIESFDEPDPTGSYNVQPEDDTVYILEAHNLYTGDSPETDTSTIKIVVPPPVIEFFIADPNQIVEGTPVAFNWRVTGADSVSIESDDPVDRPVPVGPAGPPINRQPTRTTLYTIKAAKGEATAVAYQEVIVDPAPTPTATPAPPQIIFFTAEPDTLVLAEGDSEQVTLSWSITGETTDVQISSPSLVNPLANLNPQGVIDVTVAQATLFVLTAFNQDQKTSQNVQIQIEEPTPTPTPLPPAPIINSFQAVRDPNDPDARVELVSAQPGSNEYNVVAGSNVRLTWNVANEATDIILTVPGAPALSGQPPQQTSHTDDNLDPVTGDLNYQLTARNEGGSDTYTIIIHAQPQEPPPPPERFVGAEYPTGSPTGYLFTWEYNEIDYLDELFGFRIYRVTPGGERIRVEDERTLSIDMWDFQWIYYHDNSVVPTDYHCGVYYIVAVYENMLTGRREETNSAADSWSPWPCPPP